MGKKLVCLVIATLAVLGVSPGAAWAANGADLLKTGGQNEQVGFQESASFGIAAIPSPQIGVAKGQTTTADAGSPGLLEACLPGDSGAAVTALQQRLKSLDYYDYSRITGYYGPVTLEAVKRFQRVNGLGANGVAEPETLALLASENAAALCLYPGDRGSNVLLLQRRLSELDYLIGDATGCLDDATVQALKEFQAQTGCRINGRADQYIRARLGAADAPPWDGVRRISRGNLSTTTVSHVDKMLSFAVSLLGRPYAYHGEGPSYFDADGFVCYVLRNMGAVPQGIDIAALSDIESWEKIMDISALTRGDILFFTSSSGAVHAGINLGSGQFIHASASKGGVVISRLSTHYQNRFLFARRVF
jgi:peptidoglycan hydrolase-like protein with peptidoglycan-binding domain